MYFAYYGKDYLHDPRTDDVLLTSPEGEVELNCAGNFNFSINYGHPLFGKLVERNTKEPIFVYNDDELIFFGDIIEAEQDFQLSQHIQCRGALGWLNDTIVRPYSTLEDECDNVAPASVDGYFEWLIENHNSQVEPSKRFKVGKNEGSLLDANNYIYRSDSTYPTTGQVIEDKILDSLGGYVQVRREDGVNYIDLLADFETVNAQVIEFGENLLDFAQTDNTDAMATFIVPLGKELDNQDDAVVKKRLTIESLADEWISDDYHKSGDLIYCESAVKRHGWIGAVVEFDDVTETGNLLDKGLLGLKALISPVRTIELKAVDKSFYKDEYQYILPGHYVRAKADPHNFDSYMLCSKLEFNLEAPESNVQTLGQTFDRLTGVQNKKINALNATINGVYEAASRISAEAKAAAIIASGANETAQSAQQIAASSSEVAAEALESATQAASKADAAQETANAASEMATSAGTASSEAKAQASQALADATAAAQEAASAKSAADEATANVALMESQVAQAVQDAADAKSEAASATASAGEAASAASAAQTAAQEAKDQADAAKIQAAAADTAAAEAKADAAEAIAAQAEVNAKIATIEGEIDSVTEDAAEMRADLEGQITTVSNTMQADYAKKTELTETTATLRTEIETSAAGIRQEVSSDYAKKTELTSVESSLQTQITQNADSITSTASKVETIEVNVEKVQEDADAAQAAADAAQADADQAAADAAQAQADATAAAQAATAAQSAADAADAAAAAAQAKADAAQDDLDDAKQNLEAVTSRVGATEEEIAEAQAKVNAAQSAADSAAAEAATAKSAADSAAATASNAQQAAAGAQSVANAAAADAADAQAKADNAVAVANGASSEAAEAYAKAQEANETAAAAQAAANTAKTNADQAVADAAAAQTAADEAQAAADKAQEDLATANSELATAKQNLEAVTSRVGATEEEIAEAQAAVEAAQADADAAATAAANAQSTADTAKANATTAQSVANQAKQDAATAQSAADAAQEAADQAQADVNALTNRVTTAETKIEQNTEAITLRATKAEVTETLGGYYTKSEADAKIKASADSITSTVSSTYATKTALSDTDNKINNLEVGGRNLVPSSRINSVVNVLTTEEFELRDVWASTFISNQDLVEVLEPATQYTVKYDLELIERTSVPTKFDMMVGFLIYSAAYSTWISLATSMDENAEIGTTKTVQITFTTPDIWHDESLICYSRRWTTNGASPVGFDAFKVTDFKIEKGNKATDWTPAPEDVDQNIEDAASAVSSELNSSVTELRDGLTSANDAIVDLETSQNETYAIVSSNTTKITELAQTVDGWSFDFTTLEETVTQINNEFVTERDERYRYIKFIDGEIWLGKEVETGEDDFKLVIRNDRISFLQNNIEVAYLSNNKLYVTDIEVTSSLKIAHFAWEVRTNGNIGLRWISE